MKKLTSLILLIASTLIMSMSGVAAQTTAEDRKQLNNILHATPQLEVYIEYPESRLSATINGVKYETIEKRQSKRRGSGVVVGRSKNKKEGAPAYTYYILSCKHIFQYGELSVSKLKKMNTWLYFFSYKGLEHGATKIQASGKIEWFSHGLDAIIISFQSSEDLPVAPLFREMPKNLFGFSGVAVGYPYNCPTIIPGLFGVNAFFDKKQGHTVGFNSHFAPGLSGGGVYIKDGDTWKLAGLATYFVRGRNELSGSMGGVTRIDYILAELELQKKDHLVKVE